MEELKQTLITNRPKLSAGSIRTYVSILKNLFYKHHDKETPIQLKWFHNQDTIIKHLEEYEPKKRKTILASLIVLCGEKDCKKYSALMDEDMKVAKKIDLEQNKTDKQKENWIDYDKIKELYDAMFSETKKSLFGRNKKILEGDEQQSVQNVLLLGLTSGVLGIEPRRALDYTEMVMEPAENSNYIKGTKFVFGIYKTAKSKGIKEIPIPKETMKIINAYKKVLPTDQKYMFVDKNGNKLDPTKLGQRLNKVFGGRKLSVSMLRHIYLTQKYKDVPALKEMIETADNMGHSLLQALEYVKKD